MALRLRVGELCQARNWSALKLSRETGMAIPTAQVWYSGKVQIWDSAILEELCRRFGVEPGDLMYLDPPLAEAQVVVEFRGGRLGTMSVRGQWSGEVYRYSASPGERFITMWAKDWELLQQRVNEREFRLSSTSPSEITPEDYQVQRVAIPEEFVVHGDPDIVGRKVKGPFPRNVHREPRGLTADEETDAGINERERLRAEGPIPARRSHPKGGPTEGRPAEADPTADPKWNL